MTKLEELKATYEAACTACNAVYEAAWDAREATYEAWDAYAAELKKQEETKNERAYS